MSNRTINTVIIHDPNSLESRQLVESIGDTTASIIEIQRVRNVLPGIRAVPAIGALLWSDDLQGVVSDIDAFRAYIAAESDVRSSMVTALRYLPDSVVLTIPHAIIPAWDASIDNYVVNDVCLHNDVLRRCVVAHEPQEDETQNMSEYWKTIQADNVE